KGSAAAVASTAASAAPAALYFSLSLPFLSISLSPPPFSPNLPASFQKLHFLFYDTLWLPPPHPPPLSSEKAHTRTQTQRNKRKKSTATFSLCCKPRKQTETGFGFYPKVKPCLLLTRHLLREREAKRGSKVEKSRYSTSGVWSTGSQEVKDGCGCPRWLQGSCLPLDFQQHQLQSQDFSAFSSSSSMTSSYMPGYAKLNKRGGAGGWSPSESNHYQWLQVDFGNRKQISAIATQGRYSSSDWVTQYRMLCSDTGRNWKPYHQDGNIWVTFLLGEKKKKEREKLCITTHRSPKFFKNLLFEIWEDEQSKISDCCILDLCKAFMNIPLFVSI
uniref:Contactin associated protein 2 n=1 Tax=Gallus gallus TaxID=9031 RepID=A0A8V0XX82_CHICK